MKNILLSYPRSGNHLTRFMIELLTEIPTLGCHTNNNDITIYKNTFPNKIPFNINLDIKDIDTTNSYHKYHTPVNNYDINNLENLIFIIRNPKEVLLRHNDYQIKNSSFDLYFNCIDFYLNFSGKKILFFYEDIVTNKVDFIKNLYDFLDIKIPSKLEYVLNNIDFLFEESKKGKKRDWGGVNSDSINFYYDNSNLTIDVKENFDNYLKNKLMDDKYAFIIEKYSIII
jgi:hypothetical protein